MNCDNQKIEEILEGKLEELSTTLEDSIEEKFEELTDSLENSVESSVENAIQNFLSKYGFILPDGTRVISQKQMSLTSPDKTKVLLCYGGLRVEDTSKFSGNYYPVGWGLSIQTRIDSWDIIYIYETKDEATKALEKVKNALISGADSLDL